MSAAGIDAMILVYAGIVPANNPTLAELRVRAIRLLDKLADEEVAVILPTIAISELLVPVPQSNTGKLIGELASQFVCPTFDLQAASIAATIWAAHKKLPRDQQYKDRIALKADAMIVASAKAAGATVFYSNDKNCRALAKIVMEAEGLPAPAQDLEQQFIESDIRSGDDPPPRKKKPSKRKKSPESGTPPSVDPQT